MGLSRLVFLSRDEIELIHETSLKILQEVGVKVLSSKIRTLMAEKGAEVDEKRSIVKIPETLVEEALKKAPKEIILCGREPKHDLKLPSREIPFAATGGIITFIRDMETGEKRMSTSTDLKNFAIISDYLDQVDFFWPTVVPTDIPPALQSIYGLAISFEFTGKHIQYEALNEKDVKWQIRLASAIVGDEKKLRKRPIFSTVNCPVSPLAFEKDSVEAMVELAKAGIPFIPFSQPLCGSTAPATLAGTLTIFNAENLAAITIVESVSPGAPVIYGGEPAPIDGRTGEINYKAPECPLLAAGIAQMARFYGLPTYTCGVSFGETPSDWQTLLKDSVRLALLALARGDITAGFGCLENAKSSALEQVILDVEGWIQAKAYLRTFDINEDTLGFDVISKVGPGGLFLGEKHTMKHFRKELWLKEEAEILPSTKDIVKAAKEKVREILKIHEPTPLEEDVKREVEQILQQCRKDILG